MTHNNNNIIFLSFLFFVFALSNLTLSSSAEKIEDERPRNHRHCAHFQCGDSDVIQFPFTKTTSPECGLYTVDCTDSNNVKIRLKPDGHWYRVERISQAKIITINDAALGEYIRHPQLCHPFESFGLPCPSPISNVSTESLLFALNCTRDTQIPIDLFRQQAKCGDYDISLARNLRVSLENLRQNCSIVELPWNYNFDSIVRINLTVVVSSECYQCHYGGGQCRKNKENKFYCENGINIGGSKNNKLGLGLGLASIVVIVGVLIIIRFLCLRNSIFFWKNNGNETQRTVETFLRNYGPLQVKRYSYKEIKIITNRFGEKLGQGGFGDVYKGKLDNSCLVAVKVLKRSKSDNCEDFINEVATISHTSHVNIVALLGFCFEGSKRALIYEFMPNGSLEKFAVDGENHKLDWEKHYRISLGIARGLEYLHRGCNTRIVHFDIKPHNILLDADFVPKISDFGLAKTCAKDVSAVSMEVPRGTIGYIAPEIVSRCFGEVSNKSDVYSYGMMILEMVGGRRNINVDAANTTEIYFPHWIHKRLELDEEFELKNIINEDERKNVRKMIIVSLWCIQTEPSKRPTMSKVIKMLEGNLDSLEIPPKPVFSAPSRSPKAQSSTTFIM